MIVRFALALALLILARGAPAATVVHKCGLADGRVVYQGGDCGPGQRMLERWNAPPDPPQVERPKAKAASLARGKRTASTARYRAPSRTRMPTPDPCAAARQRRDEVERRVGLARTYELLTALQRDVYDACK